MLCTLKAIKRCSQKYGNSRPSMIILILGTCILNSVNASNILLLQPLYSKSRDGFHSAIARYLLAAGHHVTTFTNFPGTVSHPNYTEVDLHHPLKSDDGIPVAAFILDKKMLNSRNNFELIQYMIDVSERNCIRTIQTDEMQDILKIKKKVFDIVVLDLAFFMHECLLYIAEHLDIPAIGTITLKSHRSTEVLVGNYYSPAVLPDSLSYHFSEMTFFQRITNAALYIIDIILHKYIVEPRLEKFRQTFFPHLTTTSRKQPSLIFLNDHPVLTPRSLPQNIIALGGMHIQPVQPLPPNFRIFIEEAENGVILFTLGSVVQSHSMPTKILSIFREAFAQLPQRVIWKSEKQIDDLSDNVLLSKWVPQKYILAHENVIAFISHGGGAGIYESLHGGTPLILTPAFGDQISNAALMQQLGVGICLHFETLSTEKLLDGLAKVINSTKYSSRMKTISKLIKEQPMNVEDKVTYWTEYVIRHNGAQYLNSVSLSLPLHEYLLLDAIGFIFFATVFIFCLFFFFLKMIKLFYINK